MQWSDKRVVVTGGAGFLGSFLVEKLSERGCKDVIVPRSKEYDLRDREAIVRLYKEVEPHIVIHLAAVVGGIGANGANLGYAQMVPMATNFSTPNCRAYSIS